MAKHGICFIGTGWMGTTQLRFLLQMKDRVEIKSIVNNDVSQARQVASELGIADVPITTDYKEGINRSGVDITWIVSPNSFHAPQAIYALEHGCHVFCEKPASTDFDDFIQEIRLSNDNPECKSMVDYLLYFNPMEQKLRSLIERGQLGDIFQIQVNYRHPVNIKGDKTWKLKKSIVGDALGMGINHAISVLIFAMQSQAQPCAVYATSYNGNVRGFEVDPVWNILIKFDNGASGLCLGNIDNENGYDLYHSISGSKGGFIFDSRLEQELKIRYWSDSITNGQWVYPLNAGSSDSVFPHDVFLPDSGDVMDHQVNIAMTHFLDSVDSGIDSPLSFVNSRVISEIGWAAQLSAKEHREVMIPLSDEDKNKLYNLN